MAELKDKYISVLKLAKTLGCKKVKTGEENGQLVVNANCPTQYLANVITEKAKEVDAEHKDLALKLKVEMSSDLTNKYGSVYEQAYTLGCEELTLTEENGVLTVSANCPTQYNADRVTDKAKKVDAEWKNSLKLDLKVQRTDIYGEHKIKADDTLEVIAKKITKNKVTPEQIFEANKDVLTDPKTLPAKTTIKIPNWDASAESEKPKKKSKEEKPATEALEVKGTEALEVKPVEEKKAEVAVEPVVAPAPEAAKAVEPVASSPASPEKATREVIEKVAVIVEEINTAAKAGDESDATVKTIAEKVENLVEQAKPTFVQPEVESAETAATPAAPAPTTATEPTAASPAASPQQATREVIEKVAVIVEEINTAAKTGDESDATVKTIAEKVESLVEQAKPTFVQPEAAPVKEEKPAPLASPAPTNEVKAEEPPAPKEQSVAKSEAKKSSEEEDDDDDGDDDDDDDGDDDGDDGYDDDDDDGDDDDDEWEDDEDDDDGDDDGDDDDDDGDDDDDDDDEEDDDDDGDDDDDDGDDDDDDDGEDEWEDDEDDDDGDDDDDGEEEEKKPVDKKKSKK